MRLRVSAQPVVDGRLALARTEDRESRVVILILLAAWIVRNLGKRTGKTRTRHQEDQPGTSHRPSAGRPCYQCRSARGSTEGENIKRIKAVGVREESEEPVSTAIERHEKNRAYRQTARGQHNLVPRANIMKYARSSSAELQPRRCQ